MLRVARALVYLVAGVLLLLGLAISIIETGWAKNRIREQLVRQANQYLAATLTIGRLEGSLFRGIQLGDIDLSRGGRSLIRIDEIALSYSLRELFQSGTVIRRLRLTRPRVVASKLSDGKWDLGGLIKRERQEERRLGPGRPIEIQSVEIDDGQISLHDPLDLGAAHLPTEFSSLNASFSFAYYPVRWRLRFDRLFWIGRAPDLTVTEVSGTFGLGPGGWFFDRLLVHTPRSNFRLDGRITRDDTPTQLDLGVHAERFAFQEWSGILRGLKDIAVEASFDTSLKGPLAKLETDLRLTGTGGSVGGRLTLDTTVPGWHGAGAVDVARLDLARWLNRPDRPSDISGHVTFDLALELGRHFPRGTFTFRGPHAMFMNYAADAVYAQGQIVTTAALIASAAATAYGAHVTAASGSIGLDDPYPYHFQGTVTQIDLRNVPASMPVPRVESSLTLEYDVSGRFANPAISGQALFAQSTFLGATIQPGTSGSIDTFQEPFRFTGDGEVRGVNVRRIAEGLDVGWMRDPRYAGTVSGRFRVDGAGSGRERLTLSAGGHLTHAEMFHGTFNDAEVSLWIERGSLRASYAGRFSDVDPAVLFGDARFEASLKGSGTLAVSVRDLLVREPALADYDLGGSLALDPSTIRGVKVDVANVDAALKDSILTITRLQVDGPALEGQGSGTIALPVERINSVDGAQVASDFQYDVTRLDLAESEPLTGRRASGTASTHGTISGPWTALRVTGEGSVQQLHAFDLQALTLDGHYDATVQSGTLSQSTARVDGHGSFVSVFQQQVRDVSGTITLDAERVAFDLRLAEGGRSGRLTGMAIVKTEERSADVLDLTVTLGNAPWRLARDEGEARIRWDDRGFGLTPMTLVAGSGGQRIDLGGDWRSDGTGALRLKMTRVFLDTLQTAFERPARYGGVVDLDATIRGTRERPVVSGSVAVTNGRVERVTYQSLAGRFDYDDRRFSVDLRLDQSPGVWITATGDIPMPLFNRDVPAQPLNLSLKSSAIDLGLVEGVTNLVRRVSGEVLIDVKAVGTSHDPHFIGSVAISRAAFEVTASGVTYRNAWMKMTLAEDRVDVEAMHLEDARGHPLDIRGSLGTHELRVGDLRIDVDAQRFEIIRNEFGRMDVDAKLQMRGRSESPRLTGVVTIHSGELNVDEVLQRTVFRLYGTEPASFADTDPLAALNRSLWERLGMDVGLHVPSTLRFTGDNVQVSSGTPIGIGNINLRVTGDLYFYKDPFDRLYITGALDQVRGTYAFQGRRFDVNPSSSIIFRGDANPDLYIGVRRVISGVEVRVGLIGPLRQPELRLASTPPLDESEILSLVVFNTTTNQLTPLQQQDLFVRAGVLAAGFVATPLVTAVEGKLGLDILEIEPRGDFDRGPKVTVGEEIAPGLVARFSRQFGSEPYDEATVEYYLSRILRLRATFSDAQSLSARSPFRRVERAGVDLLFFFSF